MASVSLDLRVEVLSPILPIGSIEITSGPSTLRHGEVGAYEVEIRDKDGEIINAAIGWTVDPAVSGFVTEAGKFVGYQVGPVRLIAGVPGLADTVIVQVTARGIASGSFRDVGAGPVSERYSSEPLGVRKRGVYRHVGLPDRVRQHALRVGHHRSIVPRA